MLLLPNINFKMFKLYEVLFNFRNRGKFYRICPTTRLYFSKYDFGHSFPNFIKINDSVFMLFVLKICYGKINLLALCGMVKPLQLLTLWYETKIVRNNITYTPKWLFYINL